MVELKGVDDRRRDEEDEPHGVDRWVMPYLEDSTLWPVTIVIVVHIVAFMSPALLFAVRDRRPGAMLGCALMLFLSVQGVRWELAKRGKIAAVSWLIFVTWALGIGAAYFLGIKGFM